MLDGEWVLTYPGVELTLGGYDPAGNPFRAAPDGIYHREAPDLGEVSWLTDDVQRPRADGIVFGTDHRSGRTVTFTLRAKAPTEAEVLTLVDQLEGAWRADPIRLAPNEVAALATQNAGRQRVVYGRPRRYKAADAARKTGRVDIVADFACAVAEFFAPAVESVVVGFVPPPSGGFLAPFVSPLTTVPSAETPGAVSIGGTTATWPWVSITGPITNPEVRVTNEWSLKLLMTIPGDQTIVLDTRPWRQSVTRVSDNASYAGNLDRSSWLEDARLDPGTYEVALRGIDATGTSSMVFAWQSAYNSI